MNCNMPSRFPFTFWGVITITKTMKDFAASKRIVTLKRNLMHCNTAENLSLTYQHNSLASDLNEAIAADVGRYQLLTMLEDGFFLQLMEKNRKKIIKTKILNVKK